MLKNTNPLLDNCPIHPHVELSNIKITSHRSHASVIFTTISKKKVLIEIPEMQATDRNVSISISYGIIILHNLLSKVPTETIRITNKTLVEVMRECREEVLSDSEADERDRGFYCTSLFITRPFKQKL